MKQSIFKTALVVLAPLSIVLLRRRWREYCRVFRGSVIYFIVAAEQNARMINVRELGARGDGVSDDTRRFRRRSRQRNRRDIKISAGVYLVSNLQVKTVPVWCLRAKAGAA
jgi:hypothetical protein